jgi:hypothetical protein
MYEFHGWANIHAIYENVDIDNEDQIMDIVINKIKKHIEELDWKQGVLDLRATNANFHLRASGIFKEKVDEKYCPIELFKYIGRVSPGSYGILYVLDNENSADKNDKYFKVFALSKGQLCEHNDPYLSPLHQNQNK